MVVIQWITFFLIYWTSVTAFSPQGQTFFRYKKSSLFSSAAYVDINLGQYFVVEQFLDIYKGLSSPIKGVIAFESKEGESLLVLSSKDVYSDIKKKVNESEEFKSWGLRVQSFLSANDEMLEAYKNELIRQTNPSLQDPLTPSPLPFNNLQTNTNPTKNPPKNPTNKSIKDIVSPFADAATKSSDAISTPTGKLVPLPFEKGIEVTDPLELTAENVHLVLDEVRPYLIADGGNVAVVDVDLDTREIKLSLQGACGSCPSSTTTMKMGIERILKQKFLNLGEITAVSPDQTGKPFLSPQLIEGQLSKIMSVVTEMGGVVRVKSVDASAGLVEVGFSGPPRLKQGIELIIQDLSMVKTVVFTDL